MTVNLYNQAAEAVGTLELPERVFGVKWNPDLVHQAVVAQMANARKPWAHTKTRGEVAGGGRKPWRQKGTGRARHGSIRSPLWAGGGTTFGPRKEKSYAQKINKKMKQKALLTVLSQKARDDELVVISELNFTQPKTKEAAALFTLFNDKEILKLRRDRKNDILVILPGKDEAAIRTMRNIPYTKVTRADSLNVADVLNYRYLLMPKESIGVVEKTFTAAKSKIKNQRVKTQT